MHLGAEDLFDRMTVDKSAWFLDSGCTRHICSDDQAPRAWYQRIDTALQNIGVQRSVVHDNFYSGQVDGSYLMILLYVDDLLIASAADEPINKVKTCLTSIFSMKDMGRAKYNAVP